MCRGRWQKDAECCENDNFSSLVTSAQHVLAHTVTEFTFSRHITSEFQVNAVNINWAKIVIDRPSKYQPTAVKQVLSKDGQMENNVEPRPNKMTEWLCVCVEETVAAQGLQHNSGN